MWISSKLIKDRSWKGEKKKAEDGTKETECLDRLAEPTQRTHQHQGESFREEPCSAESHAEGWSEARASRAKQCLQLTYHSGSGSGVLNTFLPKPNMKQNLAEKRQQCGMFEFRPTEFHYKSLILMKKHSKSGLIFASKSVHCCLCWNSM